MSGDPKLTVFLGELDVEVEIATKLNQCPRCQGKGTHVNPSIDGHGLSREDFDEDPDFEEAYFRGDYDVACHRCGGRKVIAVPDWAKLSDEEKKAWKIQERELADMAAEEAAERRAGA